MARLTLDILYQDEFIVAVNKPAGMLVHRTYLDPDSEVFAVQIVRDQIGRWVYPVHRLDKPTSGVLLFGLTPDIARIISQGIDELAFHKTYLAVLRGYCPESGEIDYDLPVGRQGNPGKSLTRFTRLATAELNHPVGIFQTARYSLVSAEPVTGRRHQLRRHFKHIFYNIIGDTQFGDRAHNRFFRDQLGIGNLFLHSALLEVKHPVSGETLIISADLPENWSKMAGLMGWNAVIADSGFRFGQKERGTP
jgi:tRNA pseudouridine65 synthase